MKLKQLYGYSGPLRTRFVTLLERAEHALRVEAQHRASESTYTVADPLEALADEIADVLQRIEQEDDE